MECLCSLWENGKVTVFECFGECVEQGPDIPFMELLMPGLSPFPQDYGNQSVGTCTDIGCPNDQVMRFSVFEVGVPVGVDPHVLIMPFIEQLTDGLLNQEW